MACLHSMQTAVATTPLPAPSRSPAHHRRPRPSRRVSRRGQPLSRNGSGGRCEPPTRLHARARSRGARALATPHRGRSVRRKSPDVISRHARVILSGGAWPDERNLALQDAERVFPVTPPRRDVAGAPCEIGEPRQCDAARGDKRRARERRTMISRGEKKEGTPARRCPPVLPTLAIRRRLHFVWRCRGPAPHASRSLGPALLTA